MFQLEECSSRQKREDMKNTPTHLAMEGSETSRVDNLAGECRGSSKKATGMRSR